MTHLHLFHRCLLAILGAAVLLMVGAVLVAVIAKGVCPWHPAGFTGPWHDDPPTPEVLDDDFPSEAACAKCGGENTEWEDCYECGGEGEHDCYEEDPINYAEGEEFDPCSLCHGNGGWRICHDCIRKSSLAGGVA